jgi:hypothetical protein
LRAFSNEEAKSRMILSTQQVPVGKRPSKNPQWPPLNEKLGEEEKRKEEQEMGGERGERRRNGKERTGTEAETAKNTFQVIPLCDNKEGVLPSTT